MSYLKKCRPVLFIVFAFVNPKAVNAQTFSKEAMTSAINVMAKLIEDKYVFAEKGKKIAANLSKEHRSGKFDQAKNWKDFDSLTTRSLRDFSKDGHLYVRNNPLIVKQLQVTKDDDNEESMDDDESVDNPKDIENNFGFREVRIMDGNTGYIKLSEYNINEKSIGILFAAMQFIENTKALIIDLRDNGGGGSKVGPFLESFFLPKNTPLLELKTRKGNVAVKNTLDWLPQKKYEKPLYIIVNNKTASAAEYFAYVMQLRKRGIIVGQPSAGAANMNSWYVVNDHIFLSVSTASPTIPGTEESWEQKGVQPEHPVAVDKEVAFILNLLK